MLRIQIITPGSKTIYTYVVDRQYRLFLFSRDWWLVVWIEAPQKVDVPYGVREGLHVSSPSFTGKMKL